MRLINAEMLLRHAVDLYDAKGHLKRAIDIGRVMSAKTADAVEVVRCKECIYAEGDGPNVFFCEGYKAIVTANDFCSNGEKEEA